MYFTTNNKGFTGHTPITIQPRDLHQEHIFNITICSSKTANDGYIPYDTTVSGVTITALTSSGTIDTELVYTYSASGQEITALLDYPETNGDGRYKLRFDLELDSNEVREIDFNRITCKDK